MLHRELPLADDELFLANRGELETAWSAINIAGNAPTLAPILDAYINLMPSASAPEIRQMAAIHLHGSDEVRVMRQELEGSLRIVTENTDESSQLSKAAKGLLEILSAS